MFGDAITLTYLVKIHTVENLAGNIYGAGVH